MSDDLETMLDVVFRASEEAGEQDYTEALDEAITVLQDFERSMYLEQRGPNGQGWAPIAFSTANRKGHTSILVDTGRMFESLTTIDGTQDTIWQTGKTWLRFGTSVPYAHWHQTGTRRMPARPHVGVDQTTADRVGTVLGEAVARRMAERIKHG